MYSDIPFWLSMVFLFGGLVALAWSSDVFVDGAAVLAKALGISPFVIGMVIIGFGTSAPELCVSAMSGLHGHADLSLGNAYGSCIFNIAVILGVAVLIFPLVVRPAVAFVAGPALALVAGYSMWILRDGICSRSEAISLLVAFAVVLPLYCWFDQKTKGSNASTETEREERAGEPKVKKMLMPLVKLVVGLGVLIGSSHYLVWGAVDFAKFMGVSDLVIGLTIIAAGTSLPELASAIQSARRGEHEFVLGNIIGSNLFNTLAVVGIATAISPVNNFSPYILTRDLPLMIVLSLSITVFGLNWRHFKWPGAIRRREAIVWLVAFAAYTALMFYQETRCNDDSGASAVPAFMTRDDGTNVTCVAEWKPRMLEITRKFERKHFGLMPATPKDLKVECLSEEKNALGGKATFKRLKFSWGRVYDKGTFHATAVLPNRTGSAAAFLYVREAQVSERPESSEDWPIDDIVSRGYATVAFDGGELTSVDAKDAVTQRAWALRQLYEWCRGEARIDEMTCGPVGCGKLDGTAALWAGSYDWRFYLCIAAQTGLGPEYIELASNNTPGLLYTCSASAQPRMQVRNDRALAEAVTPAWTIYNGLKGFGGNTDWHLREGACGLMREDWKRFMDFTDRHGWAIGDQQKPMDKLPPLMTTFDGRQTVKTKEEWETVRRPEIVRFFTENVYGVPPPKPGDLHFERTAPDKEMTLDGGIRVVRKQLKAVWTAPLGKGEFPFLAFVPVAEKPSPALLFLCLSKKRMDPERKVKSPGWDVEQICARGYAAVGVYYEDISPDYCHDFNVPPFNLYKKPSERIDTDWCAIAAWAWGMSRVMDWIETEPTIDAKRVVSLGHSRGGKTALWAGITDTRFAMAVPFGSGRTGMMLHHIKTPFPTETIGLINTQSHWFTPRYKALNNRDFEVTFDHHQLAACMAPRLLFVADGTGDMSRYGDWFSLVLASPAWELYGKKGLAYGPLPEVAQPAAADSQGYYLRFGPHMVDTEDWKAVMDFFDARQNCR